MVLRFRPVRPALNSVTALSCRTRIDRLARTTFALAERVGSSAATATMTGSTWLAGAATSEAEPGQ